jgi:hypothetical protein
MTLWAAMFGSPAGITEGGTDTTVQDSKSDAGSNKKADHRLVSLLA